MPGRERLENQKGGGLRVLILQDYLRCGGTERQSVHLARQLHAEGNDVSVLTFRPGGLLSEELVRAGVPHRALQPLDTCLNFLAPGLFRALRQHRPQVILCMGRTSNSYAGFIQRRFPEIAVIGTVRTGKPLPALNRWSLRQVSGVLTNTDWWRLRLIHMGVDPGRIAVVTNGLTRNWALENRLPSRERRREELQVGPSTVVFLNVAGFRDGKRHARLIEFFSTLDSDWDWRLWLVGDGRQWQRCRRLAERLEPRRIRLVGHDADPFAWYSAADVAVSVSLEDSLPNFLVEAQTLGLPVVATEFKGVGEALRHGETGFLVAPRDADAFRFAIEQLYLDAERRHRMSRQAAAFAAEHYSSGLRVSKTFDALSRFHEMHLGSEERYA